MKQLILINIFITTLFLSVADNVTAENNEPKYYNYYHRNLDGTFTLEQIENPVVPLFSYKVEYKDGSIYSITGFYYSTETIKFIDVIKNSRIIQSEYFNRNFESIYIRKNLYRDHFLNNIIIQDIDKDVSGDIPRTRSSNTWIFFEKNTLAPNYFYTAFHIREFDTPWPHNYRALNNEYTISEGVFSVNYRPISINSKVMFAENGIINHMLLHETYAYDFKGKLQQYIRTEDNKQSFIRSAAEAEGVKIDAEQSFKPDTGVPNISSLYVYKDDMRYEYSTKGGMNSIDTERPPDNLYRYKYLKDDLFIVYYFDNSGKNETGKFILYGNDEYVEFQTDKTNKSILSFNRSIFQDNSYIGGVHNEPLF